jgi:hypothetical protein
MSPVGQAVTGALALLGLALTAWGLWPAFSAWRAQRVILRHFRRQMRALNSDHVRNWSWSNGGREPPR